MIKLNRLRCNKFFGLVKIGTTYKVCTTNLNYASYFIYALTVALTCCLFCNFAYIKYAQSTYIHYTTYDNFCKWTCHFCNLYIYFDNLKQLAIICDN